MATSATDVRAPARESMEPLYARIPVRLKRLLEERAAKSRRSVSAQLEVELEAVFDPKNETGPAA